MNLKIIIPIIIIIVIGIGVGFSIDNEKAPEIVDNIDIIEEIVPVEAIPDEGKKFSLELSDSVSTKSP